MPKFELKHLLFDEPDKTIAIFGLIFTLVLTIWLASTIGRPIYVIVGILSFIACGTYLLVRRSILPTTLPSLASLSVSNKFYLALNIGFFLIFSYSLLCLQFRPDLYVRPIGYFIAIAFMSSFVAVEILFLPSCRRFVYFALLKIVLIGVSLEFSQLLLYPSILGVDPWWHQMFASAIVNTGHIPQGFGYSQLPLMHLVTSSTSLLTGLDYKIATMLSVSLPQIIGNVLLVFLFGTFLFNKKVGLLGGLLLAVANWQINMGYLGIPNTIAAVFVPIIIYLLLKVRREKPRASIFLSLFLMAVLIFTHTLTAAWLAVLLFVFWAGFTVYNRLYSEKEKPVTLVICAVFTGAMLAWWSISGHVQTLIASLRWGFSIDYFLGYIPTEIIERSRSIPFSEQLFNSLGMFLFYAISLVGCLYMISRRFGTSRTFVLAIGGVITLALGFFALVTGRSIITERWWYFSQILLALPLAISLLLFCGVLKNRLAKASLIAVFAFTLTFLMILSPVANMDNPTFSPNTQIRYALTASELQAAYTVSNAVNMTIGVDAYYYNLRATSIPVVSIDEQLFSGNYTSCQGMFILIREEIVNHPFPIFSGSYKLESDPREQLSSQGFSRVYDCGSVSGYIYNADSTNEKEP